MASHESSATQSATADARNRLMNAAQRNYTILGDARRWRLCPTWVPFGRVQLCFEKQTTWDDAYEMALSFAEQGAENVHVFEEGSDAHADAVRP